MIKVIVLDIDGTLTNNDKIITPKTKKALMDAQDKGVRLVLASGRPTKGLYKFARELGMDKHHGLFVSYNGSQVIDCQTNEILFNQTLTVKETRAVLTHLKKFDRVRPMIDHEDNMYVYDLSDNIIDFNGPFDVYKYESTGNEFTLVEFPDMYEKIDFRPSKILTTADPSYLQKHYQAMSAPFKDTLSCMFTGAFYYEYTPQGIDKAKAIDEAIIPLGYKKEDMIAFGDGQNDKSIIEYCGIGVAMENAVDELKEVADFITLSNEDDGIAYALEKYM